MRLDALSQAQLVSLRASLEARIASAPADGAHEYQIAGRKLKLTSLAETVALLNDVEAALARRASPDDALGIGIVELGEPR